MTAATPNQISKHIRNATVRSRGLRLRLLLLVLMIL
jgi:hypothetical protein